MTTELPRVAAIFRLMLWAMFFSQSWAHAQLAVIRQGKESAAQAEPGDGFGRALAVGDFNGDGFEDVATGAPFEKYGNNVEEAGAVVVNYGSRHGVTWKDAVLLTPPSPQLSTTVNNHFGIALAAGDFNNDGFDDLAVGAPLATAGNRPGSGLLLIYSGAATGLQTTPTVFTQAHFRGSNEANDMFGAALAAGKLGDDPYDDLVVGTPGEDSGIGAIYILKGGPNGIRVNGGFFARPQDLKVAGRIGDNFGAAVHIGNLFGSAAPEVIVGAPNTDAGGVSNSGRVYLLTGNPTDIEQTGVISHDLLDTDQSLTEHARFGTALAVGRFKGPNQPPALAVGSPGLDAGRGKVIVYQSNGNRLSFDQGLSELDPIGSAERPSVGFYSGDRTEFGAALAVGQFNGDEFDDLAVGSPFRDRAVGEVRVEDYGAVHVYLGGAARFSGNRSELLWADLLNDVAATPFETGRALAFGRLGAQPPFPQSRQSLLIGAPKAHVFTGQVHDYSPWRQVTGLRCRSALSVSCDGEITFALRPFEPVYTASTAKIMTVLLACEAASLPPNNPNRIALDRTYVVPPEMLVKFPWSSSCSTYNFYVGERISFESLLHAAMKPSGNDATTAIADVMTHGPDLGASVQNFLPRMNGKAAALGMLDSTFTTSSGTGETLSTAYDMWLLARFAMQQPLFATIAGNTSYSFNRVVPFASYLNNNLPFIPVTDFLSLPKTLSYSWLKEIQEREPRAVGLKPGGTPEAGATAVLAGRPSAQSDKIAFATGFEWRESPQKYDQAAALLTFALRGCALGDITIDPPPPPPPSDRALASAPLDPTSRVLEIAAELETATAPANSKRSLTAQIRLPLEGNPGQPSLPVELRLRYNAIFAIKPKEIVVVGAKNVSRVSSLSLRNVSPPLADGTTQHFFDVRITNGRSVAPTNPPTATGTLTLRADQSVDFPEWAPKQSTGEFFITISNVGNSEAVLSLDVHSFEMTAPATSSPESVAAEIQRVSRPYWESLQVVAALERTLGSGRIAVNLHEGDITSVGNDLQLSCPRDVTAIACGTNTVPVHFLVPFATGGACAGPATVVCVPPSGALFPVGETPVTCTATNPCGQRAECTFLVRVTADASGPTLVCPPNLEVHTRSASGRVVCYPPPTVSEPNVLLECQPPSGSVFPVGRNVVTCVATDSCGNASRCTFEIVVIRNPDGLVSDANGDGLSDIWQTHFNALSLPPDVDTDGDGMTNRDEARAGTDPRSANSALRLRARAGIPPAACRECSFYTIEITEGPNPATHTYQLEGSPGVVGAAWAPIGAPVRGSASPLRFEVSFPTTPQRFFRVISREIDEDQDGLSAWEESLLGTSDLVPNPGGSGLPPQQPGGPIAAGDCPCGEVSALGGDWDIHVPSIRIQGNFRLNGQPFPASFLQGANFFLRNASTGDEVYLGLSNNGEFDRRILPGKYDVIYEHKVGADVPLNSKAILQQKDFATDQVFNIDVSAARLFGVFTLNGAPPPQSPGESGIVLARDSRNGAQTELGKTHEQTYGALLILGAYDVLYSYIGGSVVPFNSLGMLRPALNLTEPTVLNIDVPSVQVSGSFFYDDQLAPESLGENGRVFLADTTLPGEAQLGATAGIRYQISVLPGEYDLVFRSTASGAVAPANSNARFRRGITLRNQTTLDVHIPTVTLAGEFRVNGQLAPNNPAEDARIWLRAGADLSFLGTTRGQSYQVKVIPGDYDILFESTSSGAVLPANAKTAIGSHSIRVSGRLDIDIPAVQYTAEILFNGDTLLQAPGNDECRIYLEHAASGDPIFCGAFPSGAPLVRKLIPGIYRVRYEYRNGLRLPRNRFAAIGPDFLLLQNRETTINIPSAPLSGNFRLNGSAFPPGPDQNAAIVLRSAGPSSGDSIFIGGTSDSTYSTQIVPGRYTPYYNWVVGEQIPRNQNGRLECATPQPNSSKVVK